MFQAKTVNEQMTHVKVSPEEVEKLQAAVTAQVSVY